MRKIFSIIIQIIKQMVGYNKTNIQLLFRKDEQHSGKVNVTVNAGFYYSCIEESNGSWTYYIPGYDICFSTKDKSKGEFLCKNSITSFVRFWMNKEGAMMLIRRFKNMGFEPTSDIWSNIIRRKEVSEKFKMNEIKMPEGFVDAKLYYSELALAA